ncbi:hypothetical protein CHH28_06465 [Bacterioplanes sanyensis]|uniref:N-acetyltransferase domain-containing protein n=1 Tax=Bacterioplanes sanyensis TaxID=1249553 RepID=A0A222FH09_9GAMM|nr:hypothetical protein CHH28_06465 [Bacterioplanes sanyensis]
MSSVETIALTNATIEDASAIAHMIATAWQQDFAELLSAQHLAMFTPQWFYQRTLADIEQSDTQVQITKHNDEVVAYLCIRYHGDDDTGELFGLYVHPQYQRQGLGRLLFENAKVNLHSAGKSEMLVWTFEGAKNNDFYRRLSVKQERHRPIVIADGHYAGIGFLYSLSDV